MSSWIVHIFYLTDQSTDGQHILAKRQRMRAHCTLCNVKERIDVRA